MLKRRLKEPFGKAGVAIGVIALVFAMLGGAYAATGNGGKQTATASKAKKKNKKKSNKNKKSNAPLNGKQKKEVKKISQTEAKKFATAGPAGAAGPAGPAGPAGAPGAKGDKGDTGGAGATGASPVGTEFTGGREGHCTAEGGLGGVEVKGANTTYLCNGKRGAQGQRGEPWAPNNTLPVGATETGAWFLGPKAEFESAKTDISFPIKLANKVEASCSGSGLAEPCHIRFVSVHGKEFDASLEEVTATKCTGTTANPTAPTGYLCIYLGVEMYSNSPSAPPARQNASIVFSPEGGGNFIDPSSGAQRSTGTTGMILEGLFFKAGEAFGTWAVTGE